jgi:hypothetical protein
VKLQASLKRPRLLLCLVATIAVAGPGFVGCSTAPKISLSGPPSMSTAVRACTKHGMPHSTLRGAYDSTQGIVNDWTRSSTPSDVSSAKVYLCYFDGGPYATSHPVDVAPFPDFNRVALVVKLDGSSVQAMYGYHDTRGYPTLPLDAPPSRSSRTISP